jgi:hypothetical protein
MTPKHSGNRTLPARRTSLAFQRAFLPASRIAIYGVLFPSQFSLLFASTACPRLFPLQHLRAQSSSFIQPGEPERGRDQEALITTSR